MAGLKILTRPSRGKYFKKRNLVEIILRLVYLGIYHPISGGLFKSGNCTFK